MKPEAPSAQALALAVQFSPRRGERPTSSSIATTALEKLPQGTVAKAEQLLSSSDGPNALEAWLKEPIVQIALFRQGTRVEDVRAVTEAFRRVNGGAGVTSAVEQRYARQLLAQVIWEAELCAGAVAAAPPAAAVPREPQRALCDGPAAEQRPDGQADDGDAVAHGGLAEEEAPQLVLFSPTGPCSHGPPLASSNIHVSNLPGPLHGSRPASASEARWRESRERGLRIAEERFEERHQRWHEKERALAGVRQLRAQKLDEARERARQWNRRVECQREAVLAARKQQQEELNYLLDQAWKDQEERVAKLRARERESADMLGYAVAARQAALEANRKRLLQQEEHLQRELCERSEQAQVQAVARRDRALKARSVGPQALRTAREMGRRQAARVERIREQEFDTARQCIQRGQKARQCLPTRPLVPRQAALTGAPLAAAAPPAPNQTLKQERSSSSSTCVGRADEEPEPEEVPWPRVAPRFGRSAAPWSAREPVRWASPEREAAVAALSQPVVVALPAPTPRDAFVEATQACRAGVGPSRAILADASQPVKVVAFSAPWPEPWEAPRSASCSPAAAPATVAPPGPLPESSRRQPACGDAAAGGACEEAAAVPRGQATYSPRVAPASAGAPAWAESRSTSDELPATPDEDIPVQYASGLTSAAIVVEVPAQYPSGLGSTVLSAEEIVRHNTSDILVVDESPKVLRTASAEGGFAGGGTLPAGGVEGVASSSEAVPLQPGLSDELLMQGEPTEELRAWLEALMAKQHEEVPAAR